MTQLLPNIFAVEVPDNAKKFVIKNGAYTKWLWVDGERHVVLNLKAGIKKLFTTKDCTEDDASSVRNAVVDAHFDTELQEWRYGFHENNTMLYENATDALQSLLRSHGLDSNKNYLLLKKIS